MTSQLSRSKLLNFWVLNAVGWLLYSVSYFSVYYKGKWTETGMILNALAVFGFGFLSCVVLRFIYLRVRFSKRSVISVALLIVAVSFLGAHFWLLLEISLNFILHGPESPDLSKFCKAISRGHPVPRHAAHGMDGAVLRDQALVGVEGGREKPRNGFYILPKVLSFRCCDISSILIFCSMP